MAATAKQRKASPADAARAALALRERRASGVSRVPQGWREWARAKFPRTVTYGFAQRHVRLWEWFEALVPGVKPDAAEVELWPRGGAKSSTVEMCVCRLADPEHRVPVTVQDEKGTREELRPRRAFALYVSGTQDQANKHTQAISAKLERLGVQRAVNRYGFSKGWRVDLLRTADGFSVMGLGLDVAARGVKLEDIRPDLIIFDDVDDRHDTEAKVAKKVATITETILPAGSSDVAIVFVQNRIHSGSIASQLADGTADFLLNRTMFEEPAVHGLVLESEAQEDGTYRWRVRGGVPTWEGQDLATCEAQINDWGRGPFLREAQHETDAEEGGLWSRETLNRTRIKRKDLPRLVRVIVGVDPPGGRTEAGIVAFGLGVDGHGYVLRDGSVPGTDGPRAWAEATAEVFEAEEADAVAAEKNFGGDMVKANLRVSYPNLPVIEVNASRGKAVRAEPVATLHEEGRIHLVGSFPELERELVTWHPNDPKSPNRLDAFVWAATEAMVRRRARAKKATTSSQVGEGGAPRAKGAQRRRSASVVRRAGPPPGVRR